VFEAISTMGDGTARPATFYDRENPMFKAPRQEFEGLENPAFDNDPVYRQNSLFESHLRNERAAALSDEDADHFFRPGR
jgi:hypothetical protein